MNGSTAEDARRGEEHAQAAESLIAESGGLPEGLMLGVLSRAAAHAALAAYYELRAQR